jgi:hypothetical protein
VLKKLAIIQVIISLLQIASLQFSYADSSKIFLRIEVISSKGVQHQWSLKCEPLGGNHPAKLKACRFLLTNKGKSAIFFEEKDNCAMMYGGSATATIKGRFENRKIDIHLDRSDGCRIKSWNDLIYLLRFR